ncbi:MAG: LamG-like jellyroll fold domain-containing protein, partial [Verrucomicrobiota bacterium]
MQNYQFTLVVGFFSALALSITAPAAEDDHQDDLFWASAVALLPHDAICAETPTAQQLAIAPTECHIKGTWSEVIQWPHIPVSAANLPDGRIVTFASNSPNSFPNAAEFTYAAVFNPVTGTIKEVNHESHDMFCAHPAMLADGKAVFAGGRKHTPLASYFDWNNDVWVRAPDMNDGRWYPTSTALPDGTMITARGSGPGSNNIERFYPGTGWERLPEENVTLLSKAFPLNWVTPSGRILCLGPGGSFKWIDPNNQTVVTEITGSTIPSRAQEQGGVACFRPGKVLLAGSNNGTILPTSYVVDMNGTTPTVSQVASMKHPRQYSNTQILPNGDVIMIGGNTSGRKFNDTGTIFHAESWNPDTNVWTELAPMTVPRNYHSISLLLPDGCVFSGGGGLSGGPDNPTNHLDAQIYVPGYLYNPDGSLATRPKINTAPEIASPGDSLTVTTDSNIDRFTMVRMTAISHHSTTDLRFLEVPFSPAGTRQYQLNLEDNPNIIMPGYWMLFALNNNGTPSLAKIIKINQVDPIPPFIAVDFISNITTEAGEPVDLTIETLSNVANSLLFTAENLPSGLQLNPRTGQITGATASVGQYETTIRITDGTVEKIQAITWTINAAEQFNSALVAHWPLDETSGTTAANLGSIGTTATLTGGPTWANGIRGRALSFDGVDDLATVNNHPDLEVGKNNADFSVSFWFYLRESATGAWRALMHKGNANAERTFASWMTPSNNTLHYRISTTASGNEGTNSKAEIAINQWTHVTFVKSGDRYQLYLNGEFDSEDFLGGASVSNNGKFYFGKDPWYRGVNSLIDDLAIYNRAITPAEIAGLSNQTLTPSAVGASSNQTANAGAPGIAQTATVTSQLGESLALNIRAADPQFTPLTLTATGLPPGLTFNTSTGVISGTATQAGTYTVRATASDGTNTTNQSFRWHIRGPLTITPDFQAPVQSGNQTTLSVSTSNPGTSFVWDFGDGSSPITTTSASVQHTYAQPGRYLVRVTVIDDVGQSTTTSFRQSVHGNLLSNLPTASTSILYSSGRVWTVNPDNDSVTVLNAANGSRLATIPVGDKPQCLAQAPDGKIWVTNGNSATLSAINPNNLTVVSTVDLPRASSPFGIAFAPNGTFGAVILENTGLIQKINPTTGASITSKTLPPNCRHLSITPDSQRILVSRFISPPTPGEDTTSPTPGSTGGEVIALNSSNLATASTVTLAHSTLLDDGAQGRGIPNYLGAAAISPDNTHAWIPSKQDNILRGSARDGLGLTFDQAVRAISSFVSLTNLREDLNKRVDHDNSSFVSAAIYDPTGTFLFTALETGREVGIVERFSANEIARIDTGLAPRGLALSDDGNTLYVHNFMGRSITVIDITNIRNNATTTLSPTATWTTVTSETLPATILRGKQLFYDARDARISGQSYMSCASCHNDGGHDGRTWDFTGFGEGLRNTIDLRGRGGPEHGAIHWSANFDEFQDFER